MVLFEAVPCERNPKALEGITAFGFLKGSHMRLND